MTEKLRIQTAKEKEKQCNSKAVVILETINVKLGIEPVGAAGD